MRETQLTIAQMKRVKAALEKASQPRSRGRSLQVRLWRMMHRRQPRQSVWTLLGLLSAMLPSAVTGARSGRLRTRSG